MVTELPAAVPSSGARLEVAETGAWLTTANHGKYAFALSPGSFNIDATKFGFFPGTTNGPVTPGMTTVRNLTLLRTPSGMVQGTITGGGAMTPLTGAAIRFMSTPLETVSVAAGAYAFSDVPEAVYLEQVQRAGYLPAERYVQVVGGNTETVDFNLTPMDFYYNVEADAGWSLVAGGDNATSGRWIRADPVGTGTAPALVQPEDDSTPAPGVACFITGNGPIGGGVGVADVDNGITTLTSPGMNLSAVTDPHVSFFYWYTNDGGSNPGSDPFVVQISSNGGGSWVTVLSTLVSNHAWDAFDFRVSDFVTPTATVLVRFIAQDLGGGSIVEAGVDDFGYYAAPPQSAVPGDVAPREAGVLRLGPNPFQTAADIRLSLPAPMPLAVRIFDASGRLVRVLHDGPAPAEWSGRWTGHDGRGTTVPSGIYFVEARGHGFSRTGRLVRIR
jgi:hypothetical protein